MWTPTPSVYFSQLYRHELREIAADFRFRVLVPLVVGLMAVTALIAAHRYRSESEMNRHAEEEYESALQGITVAELVAMPHLAIKPPWKEALLAEGDQWRTPNAYNRHVSFWTGPVSGDLGRVFKGRDVDAVLDWVFVVQVALSFGAFLLGYDSLCDSRQRARLRLVLSQPVSRWRVLWANLLTHWSALALPFLAGALLSVVLFFAFSGAGFGARELFLTVLSTVVGLWATAVFTLMASLVSALSGNPERGLVAAALVWLVTVVMVPAAGSLLAQLVRPLPTAQELALELSEIGPRVGAGNAVFRGREAGRVDGYQAELRSAAVENERYRQEEELRRHLARRQLGQVALARNLASASPMTVFRELTERLLGTGRDRDLRFLEEAWAFEDVLAAHFRKIDLEDPESPHVFFVPPYLSNRPVVPKDVPRFEFTEIPPAERWRNAATPAAAFAAWSLVLLGTVAFVWARDDLS